VRPELKLNDFERLRCARIYEKKFKLSYFSEYRKQGALSQKRPSNLFTVMSEREGDICLAEVVPKKISLRILSNSNRKIALKVGLVLIRHAIGSLKLACGAQDPKLSFL